MKIILSSRRQHYVARASVFLIIVALIVGMAGCSCEVTIPPSQTVEIGSWSELNAIKNNLSGSYILVNSLNRTTPGWNELVNPDFTDGNGWEPIRGFTGTFDGQGFEISDLFIYRPDEDDVGLFGRV